MNCRISSFRWGVRIRCLKCTVSFPIAPEPPAWDHPLIIPPCRHGYFMHAHFCPLESDACHPYNLRQTVVADNVAASSNISTLLHPHAGRYTSPAQYPFPAAGQWKTEPARHPAAPFNSAWFQHIQCVCIRLASAFSWKPNASSAAPAAALLAPWFLPVKVTLSWFQV